MHGCILSQSDNHRSRRLFMARITVTIPDNIHQQVTKMAGKENGSISYTVTRLVEIGLLVMDSQKQKNGGTPQPGIEEYCQKLIIQINGILKEIAIDKFEFNNDKISRITKDTLIKFNELKGIQEEAL